MRYLNLLVIAGVGACMAIAAGMIAVDSTCAQNVTHQRGIVCDIARGFVSVLAPQVRP